MCGQLETLASQAVRRRILRCSCGTLHVVWDNLNLSLRKDEFADLCLLAQLLERHTLPQVGLWHAQLGLGGVGLWYGPFGVTLTLDDWEGFVGLLAKVDVSAPLPTSLRDLYALN